MLVYRNYSGLQQVCFLVFFLGANFQISFGQHSAKDLADTLNVISEFHNHRSGFMMDSWDDFDSEEYDSIYFQFTNLLNSIPNSVLFDLAHEFDSSYCNIMVSPDSNLKVFQWEYINSGSMEAYQCWVLFKGQDSVLKIQNNFWINDLYILDKSSKLYLAIGYVQNCSTCFQDFALVINSDDTLNYFESEKYRYSYFSASVIQYNPDTKILSINYNDVYSDFLHTNELIELEEHFKYNGNSFNLVR